MKTRHLNLHLFASLFLLALFLFSVCFPLNGQNGYTFNYNIYNGLPSNHVYSVITDRHGYLWMATEKGVVCYNGYEFKTYGMAEGLPQDDVWQLMEDKKGRIWMCSIADEIGYIYNNKYHKAYLKDIKGTLYPKGISKCGNGIVFYSPYVAGKNYAICAEYNDTLYKYITSEAIFNRADSILVNNFVSGKNAFERDAAKAIVVVPSDKGEFYAVYCGYLFKLCYKNTWYLKKEFKLNLGLPMNAYYNYSFFVMNKYFGTYSLHGKENFIRYLDLNDDSLKKLYLGNRKHTGKINFIYFTNNLKNNFYTLSDSYICRVNCDSAMKVTGVYNIKQLLNDTIHALSYFSDSIWNNCISSADKGLYNHYNVRNNFKLVSKTDFINYVCKGGIKDSVSFWWNASAKTLMIIKNSLSIKKIKCKSLAHIQSVQPFKKDSFLINAEDNYFLIDNQTKLVKINDGIYGHNDFYRIPDSDGYFTLSAAGLFINRYNNGALEYLPKDRDRYTEMVYDSVRKAIWAYSPGKIFIHTREKDSIITKDKFSEFGIKRVERIVLDNFGNVYFKGTDNVTMYNPEKKKFLELFKNLNLKDASISVYGKILIAVGNFGVAFYNISGPCAVSNPILFQNIKNLNYHNVYSYFASYSRLLLNTDQGCYQVRIPVDSDFADKSLSADFFTKKFIFKYRDSVNNFKSGDTIFLHQSERRLQFDIINPVGNGRVRYNYKFPDDSVWHEMNANELTLPGKFLPGQYHQLALQVYDNVWKSDPVYLNLYLNPFWYQTVSGRRGIWAGGTFLVSLMLTLSVLVTRRLVIGANKRKNTRMELELKSIYAQLNPHFVFNTLNSSLAMIKKERLDEAITHISKFSRLLRSYLDSSKNRYLPLTEEINNIRTYIELQQNRFGGIFSYELIIGNGLGDLDKVKIPSLLLQPIVENAINHGLIPKERDGHLKIEFVPGINKDEIICIIEDNGIGRKQSKLIRESNSIKKESRGDGLLKELVEIVNKYEKMRIEINYTDKDEPLTGTIVQVKIKDVK